MPLQRGSHALVKPNRCKDTNNEPVAYLGSHKRPRRPGGGGQAELAISLPCCNVAAQKDNGNSREKKLSKKDFSSLYFVVVLQYNVQIIITCLFDRLLVAILSE